MPIEIRELVIRATVDPQAGKPGGGCGGSSADKPGDKARPGESGAGGDLVQQCVREVLRVLAARQER